MNEEEKVQLFRKFLHNNCSPAELQEIGELLRNPLNQELLNQLLGQEMAVDWVEKKSTERAIDPVTQQLDKQLQDRIASAQSDRKVLRLPAHFGAIAAAMAAVVLIGLIIGIWQLNRYPIDSTRLTFVEKTNGSHVPQLYHLPDGSEIHVGAGSSITYNEGFGKTVRDLTLDGQAFFDVVPDEDKPFIVNTGSLETRVLGTSFKIDAFKGHPVIVAVATGKVAVNQSDKEETDHPELLTAGERVSWDPQRSRYSRSTIDVQLLLQWKSGELVFDEQPLGIVVQEIKARYGVTLKINDPDLQSYRINGVFEHEEQFTDLLDILATVGKFSYSKLSDKQYQLHKVNEFKK